MTKALITCGNNPGVYFLEKWLPDFGWIYGDTVFIDQISATNQLLLPPVSDWDFIHQLLNICLDNQIDAVFAMSFAEQELLSEATELFSEFNISLHLPDLNSRKLLLDPAEIFAQLKIRSIKTVSHQTTNTFAEFSKTCLQLGFPTESIAVAAIKNPDLVWIVNDQLKTNFIGGKPIVSFTKAAKIFASEELLLLRKFDFSKQKIVYASFIDGNLESVWNADFSEEIKSIGSILKLNGLFEMEFQEDAIFNIKPFFVR